MQKRRHLLRMLVACGLAMALCHPVAAEESVVKVGAKQNMRATLITPDGDGPYPAVLVLHTSGGLQSADIDYARRLVAQGYVALVPAFMEAYGIVARTRADTFTGDAKPIYDDLVAALATLAQNAKVRGSKLGAVGFSNGGYFAAWLAATNAVQAGIAYYGAFSGAGTDRSLGRFREAFSAKSAPLLILHGAADGTVPVKLAQDLAAIVQSAHGTVELQIYPRTDHRFEREPASPAAQAAAADAWQRSLAFVARYLK